MYNGTPVIELSANDFNGKTIINSKFKNKYGLLKVYAPWCGYCKQMEDLLIEIASKLKQHGFVVGALNADNQANNQVGQALNIQGFPTLFLVNKNGDVFDYNGERSGVGITTAIENFIE